MSVSLADQIRCVGREIGMRRGVYRTWIASGRMKQETADAELAAMEAVYQTLKKLQRDTEDR
jgi:hypothetical protein